MPDIAIANGTQDSPEKFIDTIDTNDAEYKRQILRPAEIKEDICLMSERQRVSLILNSEAFRKELEDVMETYNRSNETTGLNSSLLSLQHLSELLSIIPGQRPVTSGGFNTSTKAGIIPINDLRGTDVSLYSRRERVYRCKLASVYRLIELFGWNTTIYNHSTVRLDRNKDHFLINPFGLLYHEITASSLIKIDCHGEVMDPGSTVLNIHEPGWKIHSAIHSIRPEVRCIIHISTPATVAVSCMKSGLLPISQEAIILGEVAYFNSDFNTFHVKDETEPSVNLKDEQTAMETVLIPGTNVLFMRFRGIFALGDTIEEAWHYATNAVVACETQLRLASLGIDNLVLPPENIRRSAYNAWRTTELGGISGPGADLTLRIAYARSLSPSYKETKDGYLSDSSIGPLSRPWRLGDLEFEALMRHLDNGGYRTGHLYRQEQLSSPDRTRRTLDRSGACSPGFRHYTDIEVPPYASSAANTIAHYYDDETFSNKETEALRSGTLPHNSSDHPWFNTPNSYTKQMISTLPGREPVAHWVSNRAATLHSEIFNGSRLPPPAPYRPLTPAAFPQESFVNQSRTPNTLLSCNYFAPQGDNPNEFKCQQKLLKEKYYYDTNTAGPQSRLLDGLTWDEARRIRDDALVKALGPGAVTVTDQSQPMIAAASKAILKLDVRDTALVYDTAFVKHNPFGQVTDAELDAYKHEVEIKNNPTLYAEWLKSQTTPAVLTPPLSVHVNVPQSTGTEEVSQMSPPVCAGGIASETSELDETNPIEKKKKKKRIFKLPSFQRKSRTKENK